MSADDPPPPRFGLSQHPLNLALRFLLEIALLIALGYWGWTQHDGLRRWLLTAGAPLIAALLWAAFRVPGDGGPPLAATSGPMRLLLEAVLFASALAALWHAQQPRLALLLAVVSALHYALSYDRVLALLRSSQL